MNIFKKLYNFVIRIKPFPLPREVEEIQKEVKKVKKTYKKRATKKEGK